MKTKLLHPIARLLLAILMCLPICGSHAFAQEAESYAVFDEATNTLTFKHDTNKPAGAFALNEGDNAPGWYKPDGNGDNTNIIKKVVFDASFANARPTSCCEWFNGCTDLTTIEGIEYLNTENVTDMSGMFWGCAALTTLDVSKFDTKNVTSMSYMFSNCFALTTLDVSNFNTQNVTNMYYMFSDCTALTTLDVSHFDTQNVTNMSGMFSECRALTTLDVSNFNTQNVTDMSYMFFNCSAITTLDIANFDTKNVTDMSYMFSDCKALKTLDVSNFDTKNVTDMNYMFSGCKALTTLDVSNFDTQNVTYMSNMFNNCSALTTLDVSNFDTKNVTNMGWMFCNNYALTTIYASDKFVTTACEEDENMFAECANLVGAVPYDKNKKGKEMANYTTGYFTYKAPTETYAVFDEATNTLTFKRDTKKPYGAFALNEGDNAPGWYKSNGYVSNANTIEKVVFDASFANARPTSCCKWFFGCTDLTTIEGIEYLNTENVTEMSGMFCGCKALTMLDVSKFDTKNVQSMSSMFWGCHALTTLDISNFDTQNVTEMSGMFDGCSALTTIYASDKFVTTACKYDYNMFKGCTNLVGAVPYDEYKIGKEMANYTTGYFTDIASKITESYVVFDEATNTLTFKRDTNKPAGAFALNEGENVPGWYKPNDDKSNTNIIKKVVFDASFANARPTNCHLWFYGCKNLTTIEGIEYLNTENVTSMSLMFSGCSALTTLNLSNFDTQSVTNMTGMFSDCRALTTLDVSNFNTQNVTDMSFMFFNCSAITTLDIAKFDTKNVTDMSFMFCSDPALTTIYASDKFVTTACEEDENMFAECTNLVGAVPYDENKVGKEMANYATGYFTDKTATGIDAPTVSDDTAAEYYDLQGRRLNAPQKGVNIVKRGKKTTKMLVK